MRREEETMTKKREKEDAKRDDEMAKKRQEDLAAGSGEVDKKFKALEYLLNQSKVWQPSVVTSYFCMIATSQKLADSGYQGLLNNYALAYAAAGRN